MSYLIFKNSKNNFLFYELDFSNLSTLKPKYNSTFWLEYLLWFDIHIEKIYWTNFRMKRIYPIFFLPTFKHKMVFVLVE